MFAVLVTAVIRRAADAAFVPQPGAVIFILPVAFSAWLGGLGPGIVATLLSAIVALYFFVLPAANLAAASARDLAYVATFAAAGIVVSALAAGLRSGRERAEAHAARAQRLQAVAAALSAELSATEAARAVLREGITALGAGRGVISLLDRDRTTLSIVASLGYDREGWGRFERFPVDGPYPVSEAVRLRDVVIVESQQELQARYPDLGAAIQEGGTAVAVPLLDTAGAVGGIYYRYDEVHRFEPEDREYFLALGRLCAAALERARLRDLERRALERGAFVARATQGLAASLDVEATAQRLAELAVPELADFCSVHLVEGDEVRTIGLAGDEDLLATARRFLELAPPRLTDAVGIGAVIRDGTALLVPRVEEASLRGLGDPELVAVALELGSVSHLSVPLVAHGTPIGAVALTQTRRSARIFDDESRKLAEEVAARAALAIENARLFSALAARERQQAAVARLGQLALTEQELPPLFDAVVAELASVLDLPFVELLELAPDRRSLLLVAGVGWRPGLVGSETVRAGAKSQAGFTLAEGRPVVVTDLRTESRFTPPPLLAGHGVVSGMTVAVHGTPTSWGVLGVHTGHPRRFTDDDVNFLVSVTNVLAGAIDRRRRSEAEREAQDINRAFIGVVSHELRTPITTIYGGAKMLGRLDADDRERAGILTDLEADAERLYRLTEDLLVLTRLERHDLEVASEPVLLSRLIERVVASEMKRWPVMEAKVALPVELDPVAGEDNYVEQILRNLIGNAAKYSPAGSTIDIVVEPEGDEVAVRICDRGPGIRDEDPERLFSLFYRSPATAQQASGAGIGLFVCHELVRAMGGRIWARRRPEGGSEFGFALRRYVEPVETDQAASRPTAVAAIVRERSTAP